MFVNYTEMTFRSTDALYNTMSYFSHTDDNIPNSSSEETTSKYELPHTFVIKDYMIRNAILNKLDKKYHYRKGRKTQYVWEFTVNVLNIDSKFWFLNSM